MDYKLIQCFSDQIFLSGFVHADPHPGNGEHCSCYRVKIILNSLYLYNVIHINQEFWAFIVTGTNTMCGSCCNDRESLSLLTVFVQRGADGKARLVLLDHGLYDHLKQSQRKALCRLYKAIIMRQEEDMEKFSLDLGVKG